jgi:cob(I)alamin adenosyltransferase
MTSFFTRSGDDGYTGLLGEGRVPKHDPVPEALGVLDEATACLGLARSICKSDDTCAAILQVQRHLYGLMAEVAATPANADKFRTIGTEQVSWLEEQVNIFNERAPAPKDFIIPGDTEVGASLDLARTVVRRAERRVAELAHRGWTKNEAILQYLNRLSSLIFTLELYEDLLAGHDRPTLAKTGD